MGGWVCVKARRIKLLAHVCSSLLIPYKRPMVVSINRYPDLSSLIDAVTFFLLLLGVSFPLVILIKCTKITGMSR